MSIVSINITKARDNMSAPTQPSGQSLIWEQLAWLAGLALGKRAEEQHSL